MQDVAKGVPAAGFDEAAWREQVLALNPWARGLTIDENDAAFAAARQMATLARHAEGTEAWNTWAASMLGARSILESIGAWRAAPQVSSLQPGHYSWLPESGENAETRAWLALARVVFSTNAVPRIFEQEVSFASLVFPHEAVFRRATFGDKVSFKDAVFKSGAGFQSAKFVGSAHFEGATFHGVAQLQGATFGTNAHFQGSDFRARVWFLGASFQGRTSFNGGRFGGDTTFAQAKFEGPADFAASVFMKGASFEGIDSAAAFSLADATFRQVPSFIGATFKGVLRLDNVETPPYRWLGWAPARDASARFRELRRRAAEAHDHERELEFFAQEIRTGRFHAKGLPSWVPKAWSWRFWFGLGFETFSDFGRSLWRPLLWWLALTAGCAAFFLGEHEEMRNARAVLAPAGPMSALAAYAVSTRDALVDPPGCRVQGREPFASTDAVAEAIQLSLKNALVFDVGRTDSARRTFGCLYGLEKDGDQQYLRVPARVSTAATMQALASGLLIFLFLLAVRNLLRLR
jgi:hypothetical protein